MAMTGLFGEFLSEARERVEAFRAKGIVCPCCNQLAKEYRRKLNCGMVLSLIHIWRQTRRKNPEDGWLHISQFGAYSKNGVISNITNMEYNKLRFWGLLKSRGDDGTNTPSAGFWKITPRGERFLKGQLTCQKYIILYDNEFVGFDGDRITIRDALGSKFDFDELMHGI